MLNAGTTQTGLEYSFARGFGTTSAFQRPSPYLGANPKKDNANPKKEGNTRPSNHSAKQLSELHFYHATNNPGSSDHFPAKFYGLKASCFPVTMHLLFLRFQVPGPPFSPFPFPSFSVLGAPLAVPLTVVAQGQNG